MVALHMAIIATRGKKELQRTYTLDLREKEKQRGAPERETNIHYPKP